MKSENLMIFVFSGGGDVSELKELLLDGWIILRADPIRDRLIYILYKEED